MAGGVGELCVGFHPTQDAIWPNAFTQRAQPIALQSGENRVGDWVAEVRDVRADFAEFFGSYLSHIDGIALMSDGDNAGGNAIAWFTHLGFSSTKDALTCPQ